MANDYGLSDNAESWRVPIGRSEPALLPPPWVFTIYRDLKPPVLFQLSELAKELGSGSKARQFTHAAAKHKWIVRTARGEYAALDPSTAIRVSALSGYWRDLVALSQALSLKGTPHAFACLPTIRYTDYIPERPFLVLPRSESKSGAKDAFIHDYEDSSVQELEVLGDRLRVEVTSLQDTALLLAATNLPRETSAARQLLDKLAVDKALARRLNFLGVTSRNDVYEAEDPRIRLPGFLEERRRELANELLRSSVHAR